MLRDWRWFAVVAAYLACVYLFGAYLLGRPTPQPVNAASVAAQQGSSK